MPADPAPPTEPDSGAHTVQEIAATAEALLREHPDALVCAMAHNGLIVPIPRSVGLWGQELIEGRALLDHVVAADRIAVTRLWLSAQEHGMGSAKVRLSTEPGVWTTLHFLDLREIHGVLLGVIVPSSETAEDDGHLPHALHHGTPAVPRFCALQEDETARVISCDEAFTAMFGYTLEELVGESVLDQIHPDDQGRAIEGWLAVLSTNRDQQTRLRRRRKDGTWVWVDTTLRNYLNEPGRNHVLVEMIDISAEMQAQEALEEREELLRRLTNAMPVGLLHIDVQREVVYNNARLLEILYGTDMAEPSGETCAVNPGSDPASSLLQTLTDEGRAAFDQALAMVLADGSDHDVEADIALPRGARRRALFSLRALLRSSGEVSGAITCVLDITDSARARHELEVRATYDTLTHCYNRSSIIAALEGELAVEDAAGTGVIYVDLDQFKPVNDRLGHAAGDELLTITAERLKQASRDTDKVGRLGGDEFLVVLHDLPSSEIAVRVAGRISELLRGPCELTGATVKVSASVGVACSGHDGVTAEDLVKLADAAMYACKQRGDSVPVLAPAGA